MWIIRRKGMLPRSSGVRICSLARFFIPWLNAGIVQRLGGIAQHFQEGSTDPGLLLGKFPEGIPQDELAGKEDRAEHMWGCVFSLLSPFSWKDFLLNIPCSLLWLSLMSCRPLPEETGMESLGSPTEDETTSCKYQPAFPRAQRKPRPRGWQLAGGGKALDSPQKKNSPVGEETSRDWDLFIFPEKLGEETGISGVWALPSQCLPAWIQHPEGSISIFHHGIPRMMSCTTDPGPGCPVSCFPFNSSSPQHSKL